MTDKDNRARTNEILVFLNSINFAVQNISRRLNEQVSEDIADPQMLQLFSTFEAAHRQLKARVITIRSILDTTEAEVAQDGNEG